MLPGAARLAAVLVAALVPIALTPAVAAADPPPTTPPPAWTTASFPVPIAPNGQLGAVTCTPDGGYCVEVGSFHDPTGKQQPLVAHRTGTTWVRDAVPAVTAPGVRLTAVSCASASSCAAVGVTGNGIGNYDDRAVAYSWNGTRWARGALVLPGDDAVSRLTGVSCGSATTCLAVGETVATDGPRHSLSYLFDGTSWTARPVPVIGDPEFPSEGLKAVSCPSAAACTAVGDGGDPAGIVLTWNGTSWRAGSPAPVPGAWIGELSGVSCPSATVCTATGYVYDGDEDLAVAQRLTAGRWTRDDVPAGINGFTDVSCPSSQACLAIATRFSADKYDVGVARRSAAGTWTFEQVPTPAGSDPSLTGVTCRAATACTVVGNAPLPFVDRLVGTTWTPEPTVAPRGVHGSRLEGVSCTTATACTAVGRYDTAAAALPLVERWDGSAWTRQSIPDRADDAFTELDGVDCPTTTACVAVGKSGTDAAGIAVPTPLLTRWTPSGWSSVPTPSPRGLEGYLNAVSCASAVSCVAVGFTYRGRTGALSYVLRGTTWTAAPVVLPAGVSGVDLTGVSCATPTSCHAVGSGFTRSGLQHVDLVWNGTAWSVGPAVGAVDAVSCVGAGTACTAVGTADPGDQRVQVFGLAAGTWTLRPTPDPGGGGKDPSYLAGVSCIGATCTAVGTGDAALVMRSVAGGAWALESAVTPATGAGGLRDVSCSDGRTCVAVGTFGATAVIEVRVP